MSTPRSGRPLFVHGRLRIVRVANTQNLQISGTIEGKRFRVSTGTNNLADAKRKLFDLKWELDGGWREKAKGEADWMEIAKVVYYRHKSRAPDRGLPFEITPRHVYKLMEATNFRCSVSGIAFSRTLDRTFRHDPWAVSIDRIDNRHGYLPDNIRVVCVAANIAMNQWGYDVLLRLANGVVKSAITIAEEMPAAANLNTEDDASNVA